MSLSPERVRELCRIRDAGLLAAAAQADPQARAVIGDATDREVALLTEAGAAARHELVSNAVGLVRSVIRQLNFYADPADAFQDAMLAVAAAVDTYDPDRGSFATYMWPHIRGAVLHAIATDSGRLHLTTSQARDRARVLTEQRQREGEGEAASAAELAAALGLSPARVERALSYQSPAPLPNPQLGSAEPAALDFGDGQASVPVDQYVGMLPSRERTLLEMLYGFTGAPLTTTQIAAALNCSPSTVDRLRDKAHTHLQQLLEHFADDRATDPAGGGQSSRMESPGHEPRRQAAPASRRPMTTARNPQRPTRSPSI